MWITFHPIKILFHRVQNTSTLTSSNETYFSDFLVNDYRAPPFKSEYFFILFFLLKCLDWNKNRSPDRKLIINTSEKTVGALPKKKIDKFCRRIFFFALILMTIFIDMFQMLLRKKIKKITKKNWRRFLKTLFYRILECSYRMKRFQKKSFFKIRAKKSFIEHILEFFKGCVRGSPPPYTLRFHGGSNPRLWILWDWNFSQLVVGYYWFTFLDQVNVSESGLNSEINKIFYNVSKYPKQFSLKSEQTFIFLGKAHIFFLNFENQIVFQETYFFFNILGKYF